MDTLSGVPGTEIARTTVMAPFHPYGKKSKLPRKKTSDSLRTGKIVRPLSLAKYPLNGMLVGLLTSKFENLSLLVAIGHS